MEDRDFFLADQFVSLIILLYDIEFTICYFSVDAWAVPPTGIRNSSVTAFSLTVLILLVQPDVPC